MTPHVTLCTTQTDAARIRLAALRLECRNYDVREARRLNANELDAIDQILDEIHRLHVAVSGQEARIKELLTPKKKAK